ncbi:MAG: LemA family protein [Actinobacteria bacterium]|nr:LemA family protein [Actinomycetota bacterium]
MQKYRFASGKSYAGWIILGLIVLVVIIGLAVAVSGYNKAVALSEAVKTNWGQVETQLQRRFDLIPNLVATVKGYATHEKELFTDLANARKAYFQASNTAGKVRAAGLLQGGLSRLLLLQERYPELKANQNFLTLQAQIEGTENRVAVARTRYNKAVQNLNTYQRTFFGRMFCSWAGVGPAEYFKATEAAATTVPQVKF